MKKIITLTFLAYILFSCKTVEDNTDKTINELISQSGEIEFYDSLDDGLGPQSSSFIMKLKFKMKGLVLMMV